MKNKLTLAALLAFIHLLLPVAGFAQIVVGNPSPQTDDWFGYWTEAVGDDRVIIGAPGDNTGATESGAAYLYHTNGQFITAIFNPTPASNDRFGFFVAGMGSDRMLISAVGDDTGAVNAGAAYLYSTNGTLLTTFTNPTPETIEDFGWITAPVGTDRVLITAPQDNTGAMDTGAAYLYSVSGTLLLTLTNPSPQADDFFGYAMAAAGDNALIVAASDDDLGATNAGTVYVFNTNGTLLTTITNPTPAEDDFFGVWLTSVGDDAILIGAIGDDTFGDESGAAYLYSLNGTLITTFTNPTPEFEDYFGFSGAAVGNDRVVIGAPYDSVGAQYTGTAYLFSTNGTLLATITNPAPAVEDAFGWSCAVVGENRLFVTAPFDDAGAVDTGRGYFFTIEPTTPSGAAPTLTIVPVGAAQTQVSWTPETSTEWVLQECTSLTSGGWSNSPSGSTNPVVVPATVPTKFYRLFKP